MEEHESWWTLILGHAYFTSSSIRMAACELEQNIGKRRTPTTPQRATNIRFSVASSGLWLPDLVCLNSLGELDVRKV